MCRDPMHLTHRVTGRGLSRLSLARPPSFPLSLSLSLSGTLRSRIDGHSRRLHAHQFTEATHTQGLEQLGSH